MAKHESQINAMRIQEILSDCLHLHRHGSEVLMTVQGFRGLRIDLNRQLLGEHKAEVASILSELSGMYTRPCGAPAQDAGIDRHGKQWTGELEMIEKLFILAVAMNLATYVPGTTRSKFSNVVISQ